MPKEEGSLNGCELARAVGAAARHRIKKAHASRQSAGLPEATGAQRAWEETCFSGAAAISGSCGFILFYFTTHFTVSRRGDAVSEASLTQNKCSLPVTLLLPIPLAQDSVRMPRQPGQRAGTQAWLANTWPSSHPGLDSGVPDPGGGGLGTVLGCQTLKALLSRVINIQAPRHPKVV